MRQLTSKEKQGLIILGIFVFIFLNIVGFRYYMENKDNLQKNLSSNQQLLKNERLFIKQEKLWTDRKAWIDSTQPKFASQGDAKTALKDKVVNSSKKFNVTIMTQPILPETVEKDPTSFQEVMVPLKVSGTLESIIRWLSELQQPEEFIAVTSLSLKSGDDPNSLICELKASLYYSGK